MTDKGDADPDRLEQLEQRLAALQAEVQDLQDKVRQLETRRRPRQSASFGG